MVDRIPVAGVIPSQAERERIDFLIEGGTVSPAEASLRVLGVMPSKVLSPEEPISENAMDAPAAEIKIDHSSRVANLIHVFRISLNLGPKLTELINLRGEEKAKLEREIRRDKNAREDFMENACAACPRQNDCDIKDKGFEDGMREVHPQLKPSKFEGVVYETESLREMIIRITKDPEAHCDPEVDNPKQEPKEEEILEKAEPIDIEPPKSGAEIVADKLIELRNAHLRTAADELKKAHKQKADRKYRGADEINSKKLETKHKRRFKESLSEACGRCLVSSQCVLLNNPNAWEDAHYYEANPSTDWAEAIDENGLGHEARADWAKRLKQDPNASCMPPVEAPSDLPDAA